jgi:ribosomal protein S18 acetylase RimI-like enzyme
MMFYNNFHLAISRHDYVRGLNKGIYNNRFQGLSLMLVEPTYEKFIVLLQTYGSEWKWDKRPKYHNNKGDIQQRLENKETKLFTFFKDGIEVGYCLVTPPEKFRNNGNDKYLHIIEIENIALESEFTGSGYGRYFLQEIFAYLFQNYETVYLSSRNTNHTGVIPFYQKMGMSIIEVEKNLPNDIIEESAQVFASN